MANLHASRDNFQIALMKKENLDFERDKREKQKKTEVW